VYLFDVDTGGMFGGVIDLVHESYLMTGLSFLACTWSTWIYPFFIDYGTT